MDNVFIKNSHNNFSWDKLGDIKKGRANLGEKVPVIVYRLLEYSLNDVIAKMYGEDGRNEVFRAAGELAGREFAKNVLDLSLELNGFIANLQQALKDLKIGILRIESFDEDTGRFILTVGEDLDCSGIPITDETVCNYDEGFLKGIMDEYFKKNYIVREIDCWATGARVCRFKGEIIKNN